MAVKDAVITAAGHADVDTVVVATNAGFSNPTRDWVAEFTRGHERPDVLLWDRNSLERMLISHPSVVMRVAPRALSPQGQLEAITARFNHSVRLPAAHELQGLWSRKDELRLEPKHRLALGCAELDHGSPEERPWLLEQEEEGLLITCALGMVSLPRLVRRSVRLGVDERRLFRLAEHLVGAALAALSAEAVRALVSNPWQFFEPKTPPEDAVQPVREFLFDPAIAATRRTLGAACAADCSRMYADPPDEEQPGPLLALLGRPVPSEIGRHLDMEKLDAPCAVGLELDKRRTCPWFAEASLDDVVEDIQTALAVRLQQQRERLAADEGADT